MAPTSFILGFTLAVLITGLVLGTAYVHLKRSRNRQANIKGYLDLIPDLTEQQREQVRNIRRVFLPRVEEIRRDMRAKRARLAELLFEEPVDRERIHRVSEEIIAHQSELEREVVEHILEERDLLSPSQRRKFYEIIIQQFASGGLGVHDSRKD